MCSSTNDKPEAKKNKMSSNPSVKNKNIKSLRFVLIFYINELILLVFKMLFNLHSSTNNKTQPQAKKISFHENLNKHKMKHTGTSKDVEAKKKVIYF